MRTSVFWLILALSLLFNVFFAAGYVQARAQAGRLAAEPAVVRAVAHELALDPAQEALFGRLQSGLREEETVFGDALALARQELREELGRPQPDVQRAGALAARCDEMIQQRQAARARRFREFVEALSPEQCHRLSRRLEKGGRHELWQRRLLEKFDADRDGRLDPDEQAAARQFTEQRRREHEQRMAELLRRFDADGDGALNEQERSAAREWRQESERR